MVVKSLHNENRFSYVHIYSVQARLETSIPVFYYFQKELWTERRLIRKVLYETFEKSLMIVAVHMKGESHRRMAHWLYPLFLTQLAIYITNLSDLGSCYHRSWDTHVLYCMIFASLHIDTFGPNQRTFNLIVLFKSERRGIIAGRSVRKFTRVREQVATIVVCQQC